MKTPEALIHRAVADAAIVNRGKVGDGYRWRSDLGTDETYDAYLIQEVNSRLGTRFVRSDIADLLAGDPTVFELNERFLELYYQTVE